MFDVGFWELAVIGIIALLVVGPERMPGMVRTAGRWAGQIQRLARDLRREIEREAQTDEFRALNREFIEEDQRLKQSIRESSAVPAAASDATTDADDEPAPAAPAPDATVTTAESDRAPVPPATAPAERQT